MLASVSNQTIGPDYVIIADDGSGPAVQKIVREWADRLSNLKYVWQPNEAFRAARIRNLATLKTDADHFVFVDGDCLLPPTFIEKQRELIRPNTLLAGGRYLADVAETEALLSGKVITNSSVFHNAKFKSISLGFLRNLYPRNWRAVRTCNFAVMRRDFSNVGGFDESYIGWGREDTDLVVRLINAGLVVRSGRFGACVYHLNHPVIDRSALPKNNQRLQRVMDNSGIVRASKTSVVGL